LGLSIATHNTATPDLEPLLPDARVWRLRAQVGQEMRLDDDVDFATAIEEGGMVARGGILVPKPTMVLFIISSPNPHPRHRGRPITSVTRNSLNAWKQMEDARWRFNAAGDPALKIFRALARGHMETVKNFRELN
jgi:hypothetical protein